MTALMGNLIIQVVGFDDTEKWDGVAGGWRVRWSVSGMLGLNRRHGGAYISSRMDTLVSTSRMVLCRINTQYLLQSYTIVISILPVNKLN